MTSKTKLKNLYVTGEFVDSSYYVTTMESVCETGFVACKNVLKKYNIKLTMPNRPVILLQSLRKMLPWRTVDDYMNRKLE